MKSSSSTSSAMYEACTICARPSVALLTALKALRIVLASTAASAAASGFRPAAMPAIPPAPPMLFIAASMPARTGAARARASLVRAAVATVNEGRPSASGDLPIMARGK